MNKRIGLLMMLSLAAWPTCAMADVTLARVFSDGMVLQRERDVPVFGKAQPGEKITVQFAGKEAAAQADASGAWEARIASGPASDKPAVLVVKGANTIEVKNVLVGEVWICSGQSNMEYPLNRTFLNGTPPPPAGVRDVSSEEFRSALEPLIRTLKVERQLNSPDLPTDGWHECGGTSLEHFSAIGYFFGKELHAELHVPIGLIESAWAGSRIEPWMPPDACKNSPALKEDAAKTPGRLDGSPVGNYYVKIVAPLAPFAARGVIWYQGESNIITTNDGMRYRDKFEALVNGWRAAWKDPQLTFIQTQLAPYAYSRRSSGSEAAHPVTALPELWEAQIAATRLPAVGVVPITDLADSLTNIHPWNKWDVGHRLALWALANNYQRKDVAWSGPVFKGVEFKDGQATITFEHTAGLKSRDGKPLTDFTLAGEDGKFVSATAQIAEGKVVVSSPEVKVPRAVRFAWREDARPNLVNDSGLPAMAFRSDAPKP